MIDTLHLTQFKSWRNSGRVALAPVTLLLGANSSGKSSLLQSLLLLKQTVAAPDRTTHLNLGGDEAHDFFSFGDFDNVLTRGVAAPRQFTLALGFQRPGTERWPTMTDIPTMAEAGLPNFVLTSWQGFVFPTGTPPAVIERISGALRQIVAQQEVKDRFLRVGALAMWTTPAQMTERANQDRPAWVEAVRISGARVE